MVDIKEIVESNCSMYGHLKGRCRKVGGNKKRGGIVMREAVHGRI